MREKRDAIVRMCWVSLLLATLSSHLGVFTSHSSQHKGMNFALSTSTFEHPTANLSTIHVGFFHTNETKWRERQMMIALEHFSRVTRYAPSQSWGCCFGVNGGESWCATALRQVASTWKPELNLTTPWRMPPDVPFHVISAPCTLKHSLFYLVRPMPDLSVGGTGGHYRGAYALRRIIYLPLPKLDIVYKYHPVEPRVGITKGFPQSPHCSLVSLVDWPPSCPAMVSLH